ncbi:MAG: hypothetical protein Q7S32_00855 [bacterium]|nr:hypothetical protein [bacterium]
MKTSLWRDTTTRLCAALVIVVVGIAFGIVFWSNEFNRTAKADTVAPPRIDVVETQDKGYYIDWLVPNELVFIKATRNGVGLRPFINKNGYTVYSDLFEVDKVLAQGVQVVGKTHRIKNITPLLGTGNRYGSYTTSLMLSVEWRTVKVEKN